HRPTTPQCNGSRTETAGRVRLPLPAPSSLVKKVRKFDREQAAPQARTGVCCLMIRMPGNAVLFLNSARGTCAAALSFGQKGPRITVFRVLDVASLQSRLAFRPVANVPNCWMTGRMTVT